MNRWREHFEELLNEGRQETEAADTDRENLSDQEMEPQSIEDVRPIKEIKHNQSVGNERVKTELLK